MAVDVWVLVPFFFLGAALYSSVGHGGATVYLAILTLAGFAVAPLSTTVLVLNIVAAGIGFAMFGAAGHLRWKLLLPFVATSVPFAYLGGFLPLSSRTQSILLGVALLAAAARFILFPRPPKVPAPASGLAFYIIAPLLGAVLGFLAGATGIGGGIFLSPILIVVGWADVRGAASVASAFIVLNSLAGLAAKLQKTALDAHFLVPLGVTVVVGALVGSFAGARRLPPRVLQVLLGCVLTVAGLKALL